MADNGPKTTDAEVQVIEPLAEARPVPAETVEPAVMPKPLLQKVDYMLHHPESIVESLRRDLDLWDLSRTFFFITLAASATYGLVMGGTNWLQGSSHGLGTEFLIMVSTSIKVPILFLLTLLIVVPPIYVSSTFVGARASFGQIVALLLGSLAITTIALASMASVAFFFSLTTRSYNFIKLMHVVIFAYAGLIGLICLARWFEVVVGRTVFRGKRIIFVAWLLLYMFVGTQLAWVMRPFVGSPDMEFEIIRPCSGNFYENVVFSVRDMFKEDVAPGGQVDKPKVRRPIRLD